MDDLLIIGNGNELLAEFKKWMQNMFEMSNLGKMTYFLSMKTIFISQKAFALKILSKFCMKNCKPASTHVAQREKLTSKGDFERVNEKGYRSLVGCLPYSTTSRPNIMFFVSNKKVLRYVKGTLSHGVKFIKIENLKLVGYSNSDWDRSIDYMKSTFGYFFTLGSIVLCWSSKKQYTIA
ncbi:laccase-2-like [Gossypium australe]|uniref:Laccase-2-like n=1 Tax=Gossypium australe TaxID=47621 RepID=A0A5B6VPK1_9ROSI|nr:laccase-2-like [Gossypium australe]